MFSYDVPDYTKGFYQDTVSPVKSARPWALVHEDSVQHAVLCLHGYNGYPGEMALPGLRLFEAGMDVYAPRYPGHGTSATDFLASRADDWIGTAQAACTDLLARYDDVSLVGHSMGGALAVIIGARLDISRLVLLAPALVIPDLKRWQVRLISLFTRKIQRNWKSDPSFVMFHEGEPDDDAYLGEQYWKWRYADKLLDLDSIRRLAVESLPRLSGDVLAISGGQDETVPPQACELATGRGQGNNSHLHVPGCTHLIPYDRDPSARDHAMSALVHWLA
ncbi:alpha/beta hydrolase [Parasphaerochaeta coccoides]|uniref:AB hydrolase-1 domain-containing protein n=1 Tax=Parasphaerochaeta coccoides (strain ATCC BAA-1237 / DSM 17374 / SPN1) TaxID=760011 RepID=F4GJE2_PARC1|nr:alpha/beta fold hydrolase [Parasphaerochaeta coccoides]AEC02207.1 hypothetical protein Spico_0983 [Parasphaerochaeta coccoides DSM 17374]